MRENFDPVMRTIVEPWEGGKDDDPIDPGGRTNAGITQTRYDEYRTNNKLPRQDVFKMAETERLAIYLDGYWTPAGCDRWPTGVDAVVMDGGVNSGVSRGVKWLQSVCGAAVDGWIGTQTIAFVASSTDTLDKTVDLIKRYCACCATTETRRRLVSGGARRSERAGSCQNLCRRTRQATGAWW